MITLLAIRPAGYPSSREERAMDYSANVTPPPAPAGLVERIWNKDGSTWTDDPDAQRTIPNALGWLTIAEQMIEQVDGLEAFAAEVRDAGFTNVFLLGMGGSSL